MKESHLTSVLRKHLYGRNISAIARELDIPKTLIHDWIQGRRTPSLKNIHHVKKIAEYLGMSLEEILLGNKKQNTIHKLAQTISQLTFKDEGREYQIQIIKKPFSSDID